MSDVFKTLVLLDCTKHVEKKGKFSYVSWAWAVRMLLEAEPTATWEVMRFNGLPYMSTPAGHFVEVAVTAGGITRSQIHPVLNGNNRPIAEPTAFDINTSIQRCLVKAIALHGLGLYIYAGEDLPTVEEVVEPTEQDLELALKISVCKTVDELAELWSSMTAEERHTLKKSKDAKKKLLLDANERTTA